jgi:hypothetical protein
MIRELVTHITVANLKGSYMGNYTEDARWIRGKRGR